MNHALFLINSTNGLRVAEQAFSIRPCRSYYCTRIPIQSSAGEIVG
jgi:hypothetical protein